MTTLLQTLIVLAVIWVLAYRRSHMSVILASIAATLILCTWIAGIAWLLWIPLVAVGFLYFANSVRSEYLSKPAFLFFKRVLPPMSSTEQEALDAGDTWWEAELFKGAPDWKAWHNMPYPELSEAEKAFLDNQTETFCQMIDDWDIVHVDKDLPAEAWDYLKKEKFFGMIIPEEYGGLGFSALAHSTIVTKIATKSCSAAVTAMVPNSLGPAELLLKYGTEDQRQHYLPRLASGNEIPCFALTGPEAGSDAGAMTDTAIVCQGEYEGKTCLGLSISWNKRYITLAPVATVLGLAFKMYDPDKLLGDTEELGITVALIPTNHPGVEIGHRHFPMSMTFMNGPTRGKDVFIPLEWIIGGVEQAGKGWKMLVECLSEGRALARIAGRSYLLEAARIVTAGAVDCHIKPSVASAIAKYHMTEMSRLVIQDAMDVHAGRGLIMGRSNYLAHAYMSMPIGITVEGANILTRNLMIFGQGAVRCHPFVSREMQAATNPDAKVGLRDFDSLIFRHIGYAISNFVRTFSLGLSGGRIAKTITNDQTAPYYQQLTRMCSALALISDVSMLMFGGELKRKERLSARLGDVLSQLYLASACLKYFAAQGSLPDDIPYVRWNLATCLYQSQIAFDEFFDNLPNRFIASVLKKIVFPWGDAYQRPSDELDRALVKSMTANTEIRDRITQYAYIGRDNSDPAFIIESAFQLLIACKTTRDVIKKGIKTGELDNSTDTGNIVQQAIEKGLCTISEGEAYLAAEAARALAIQVDDHENLDFGSAQS